VICSSYGYTRQGFYKHRKLADVEEKRDMAILEYVMKVRVKQKRTGTRKIHRMLLALRRPELVIGRDKLLELLRDHKLLAAKAKRFTRTTVAKPDLPIHPNQLEGFMTSRINQAWVADITYLNTCDGFAYLYLLTDLHSRKIIGYALANDLKAENACRVLKQALRTVSDPRDIIHHSDHGCQYGSSIYQNILAHNQMRCSMTGRNRCYDNAVAERINGILKHEYELKRTFPSRQIAREAVKDAINIYNKERLHASLGYKTPESVHSAAA
jgi:transposase InsO family protein